MLPLISIITPCYNAGYFISQSIESVMAQSFQNWELIIIDDHSKDNTLAIVQSYCDKDTRIRCLQTEYPSGSPTVPRNLGIKVAKGRYIAFLDSDDAWLPNKLEEQLKAFEDPKVAIVFSNYEKIDQNGERNHREIKAPGIVDYPLLLKGNCIGCLTVMYDTERVGKVYFKKMGHEDYVCWLSILKQGYIARNTNTIAALYRVGGASVSSNKLKAITWQWNILRHVECLPFHVAAYYFLHYAYKAFSKALK